MSSRTPEPSFPADLDRFLPSFSLAAAVGPQPGCAQDDEPRLGAFPRWGDFTGTADSDKGFSWNLQEQFFLLPSALFEVGCNRQ